MMPSKRKKWTEAEEKTLIAKYGEMVSEGTLAKMKTREKKFKPIALYVNSMHHARDPIAYPWQWTWKDVSTKVQNMRHQYSLVKQKVKNPNFSAAAEGGGDCAIGDEFDWVEGLTHWSNFLLYKEVFGDLPISYGSNGNDLMGVLNEDQENGGAGVGGLLVGRRGVDIVEYGHLGNGTNGDFGVMGLGFDYEGEEADEHFNGNGRIREDVDEGFMNEEVAAPVPISTRKRRRKKKKELKGLEKRLFNFLSTQVGQLREIESRFEQREVERDRERQRREVVQMEREQELERKLEEREKESEERERRRRDDELVEEREWEERMNRRRLEWKKRIDGMLNQHREEMGQVQTRILHEQQNLTSQLLGIVSQWAGHPAGLSDHTSASNHYISQMMQNLHHVNGMVHGDARVDGDAQDDQFIVDG
ncbi:hypothetical protein LINGRAHAP2_LOCUS34306 [Linum grandiflorum]